MTPEEFAAQFQSKIRSAIAIGINAAADAVLADIQEHVHVRTGNLRDSYAVVQEATPENPEAAVASPLEYRIHQYPYLDRPRTDSPPPLFEGHEQVFGEVVEATIAKEFEL